MLRTTQLLLLVTFTGALIAQSLQDSPKFEVAAIKSSSPGTQTTIYRYPGGRFAAKKSTLKTLIKFAYDVSDRQIFSGPDWIDSDRFDISATPETDAGIDIPRRDRQIKLMLQALLAERFHLELERETRELPVYALVIAKGEPKLSPNTAKPFAITRGRVEGAKQALSRKFEFDKVSMPLFAAELSGQIGGEELDRNVIDRTGLTGDFDFVLTWYLTPPISAPTAGPAGIGTIGEDPGPSIFSALQSQLGLKLKADKGPVEVIRVTHAERPSAN